MPPALASTTSTTFLERNLAALARAAARLRAPLLAAPDSPVRFFTSSSTTLSAALPVNPANPASPERLLASAIDPLREARLLISGNGDDLPPIDTIKNPVVVVMGFGLGYHVAALAAKVKKQGLIIVYEPDLALLAAVLNRIDHTAWLGAANILFVTDPSDEGGLSESLEGTEGILALGVDFVYHPASSARLGHGAATFAATFGRVMSAVRTTVVTTLVQSEATIRNLLQNLDHYATGPGIADLKDRFTGRPAIVVSAGPSLARNIALLSTPGLRDRFVIIAVQTVLKTLLARGIKPHFVTALDYHEISRRFYEGLTPQDVEGIELIVEPKVSPAVPIAFPGTVRISADGFLDSLLGRGCGNGLQQVGGLARDMGAIPQGATVAHLAYYVARHCGCDPVIFVGQDLGFTDGQYYAAGAAIHNTWAGELNDFNTLEMLEWQRIVRMRPYLRKMTDTLGRPIYSDEQMSTYLVQFQRDFVRDKEAGKTTIDSTEGGVRKEATIVRPLADVIEAELAIPRPPIASTLSTAICPTSSVRRERLRLLTERLRDLRRDVHTVAQRSRETRVTLAEMLEHQLDQERVGRLIDKVQRTRDEVTALKPAFELVERLNQTGALNRVRADRNINLNATLSPMQVQQRQIERDIQNVQWLEDAADALGVMLEDAARTVAGSPRQTRDQTATDLAGPPSPRALSAADLRAAAKVIAFVTLDPDFDGLGRPRDLWKPISSSIDAPEFEPGFTPLELTIARLRRATTISRIIVLASTPAAAAHAHQLLSASTHPTPLSIELIRPADRLSPALRRAARAFTSACYRGGLGNLTCFDEVLCPATTADLLARHHASAALVLGADWSFIDPALCDTLIDRYREQPAAHRVTFSQAVPGLVGCVVDRQVLAQIAAARPGSGVFASIGGVLGYVPTNPTADMLGKPMCLAVEPLIRDLGERLIVDCPGAPSRFTSLLTHALRAGEGLLNIRPAAWLTAQSSLTAASPSLLTAPTTTDVTLHLCGPGGRFLEGRAALTALTQFAPPGASITLCSADPKSDVLDNPWWRQILRGTRDRAGALHLRTNLRCTTDQARALADLGLDVISVDLVATRRETYKALTGVDVFDTVMQNLRALAAAAKPDPNYPTACGLATPWVVPRLTRCDATYEQIEDFFDRSLLALGWAVLDPLPVASPSDRITPLPLPPATAARRARAHITIGADGNLIP